MVKIIELIYSDELVTGQGTKDDPNRKIIQLWTKDGRKVMSGDTEHVQDALLDIELLMTEAGKI